MLLATVQIGITVVGATAGAFGGARLATDLSPYLDPVFGRSAEQVALVIVVAGISFLSLVLGELVPKSLALRYSNGYAFLIGRPLLRLSRMMRPLVWLLTTCSNLVLKLFGDTTSFTETRMSRDELRELVEEAAKTGSVDPRARGCPYLKRRARPSSARQIGLHARTRSAAATGGNGRARTGRTARDARAATVAAGDPNRDSP
jgi:CBS domain containing-hemolysin-like protein